MTKRDQEERLKDRIEQLEEEVSKTQDLIEENNEQLEHALIKLKLAQSDVNTIRESLDENETCLAGYQEELVSCRQELTLLSGPSKRRKLEEVKEEKKKVITKVVKLVVV